jgi:hypothetical protein
MVTGPMAMRSYVQNNPCTKKPIGFVVPCGLVARVSELIR